MSRAGPNITITYTSDLTQAEQQFEAFVRKAESRAIKLNVAGTPGSTPGTSGPATFANTAGAPSTSVAIAAPADTELREAIVRRITSERALADANNRLAAVTRANASTSSEGWFGRARGGDGASIGPVGRGGGGRARVDYGGIGPDSGFDTGISALAREESRAADSVMAPAFIGRPERMGRLGRLAAFGLVGGAGGNVLRSFMDEGIEDRLSVDSSGRTDLHRQLAAQRRTINRISSVPLVGPIADAIVEGFTGIGEATTRTEDEANRRDTITRMMKRGTAENRSLYYQNVVNEAGGDRFGRMMREAIVGHDQANDKAWDQRNEMIETDPSSRGSADKLYRAASAEIAKGFDLTTKEIARQYGVSFRQITGAIPALEARARGDTREAERLEMHQSIYSTIDEETDPRRREALTRVGKARYAAYEGQLARADALQADELNITTEMFERQGSGDVWGAMDRQQQLRRRRAQEQFKNTPNLQRAMDQLDMQDWSENQDLQNRQGDYSRSLANQVSVSALIAKRQPGAAHAEDIYQRATMSADQDVREGRRDDAKSRYEIARNELSALRESLMSGGSAVEVSAGAFGPGGTEGSGQGIEDMKATLDSIDEKLNNLKTLVDAINGLSTD